ncbi:MAG: cation:dicarboxylase symporter family transporter [Lachnospiraceae bacterium]|nr:cation:dicarboxylase symporter family transporter [Lachnospiraceae bacterium]
MKSKKRISLPIQIFICLGLGIIAGILLMNIGKASLASYYLKPIGTIFLNLLKMVVVPIVLTSIISGVVSLKDIRKIGTIGVKTIIYYLFTTAFAIIIGLAIANVMKGNFTVLSTSDLSYTASESAGIMDTIVNIFPSNLIAPMVETSMLQIIVIALFIGFAMVIAGEKAESVVKLNDSISEVFMVIMSMIIKTSPIAVFCLCSGATPVIL